MSLNEIIRAAGIDRIPVEWVLHWDEVMSSYAPPLPLTDEAFALLPTPIRERLRTLWHRITADDVLDKLRALCAYVAFECTPIWEEGGIWPMPSADWGGDWFYGCVLLSRLGEVMQTYADRGISRDILHDTLVDMEINTTLAQILYGRDGLVGVPFWWLTQHFSAQLFQLGRLQFVFKHLEEPIVAAPFSLHVGDGVLDVHIPAGSHLTENACLHSYKEAQAFYSAHFPELEICAMICDSWLLDPILADFLAADSNILAFARGFLHVRTSDEADDSILENVFEVRTDKYASLPERTALQRAIKAHLLAGGRIHGTLGVRPYKGGCISHDQ